LSPIHPIEQGNDLRLRHQTLVVLDNHYTLFTSPSSSSSSSSSSLCSQTGLASRHLSSDHNARITSAQYVPKLVSAFMKKPVKLVACGYSHTGERWW